MKYLFPFLMLLFYACSQPVAETDELNLLRTKLADAEAALAACQQDEVSQVVHTLYFSLKEEATAADKNTLIGYLQDLGTLSYVQDIKIGRPADVPDPRNRTDYDVAMEMRFASKDQLNAYQQDSMHLAIRAKAGPLLGGPPVVYDFEVVD